MLAVDHGLVFLGLTPYYLEFLEQRLKDFAATERNTPVFGYRVDTFANAC
jgi:hypothetical protein